MPKFRPTSTESTDNYLKAVFEITALQERASTNEIARRLRISAASVTGMLKKLSAATPPLITYEKRRGAELTSAGQERAVEVIRHHRLIETYLHAALDYSWDEVHAEAEKLEHFISEDLEDRMAAKLGFPEYDPHGHPIPRRDGSIPQCDDFPLQEAPVGVSVRINRVPDDDAVLLRTISGLDLELYSELEVVEHTAHRDASTVRRMDGIVLDLPGVVSSRVRVKPLHHPIEQESTAIDERHLVGSACAESCGGER